jgi:hypothetical protein
MNKSTRFEHVPQCCPIQMFLFPEHKIVHNRQCENLKSYINYTTLGFICEHAVLIEPCILIYILSDLPIFIHLLYVSGFHSI